MITASIVTYHTPSKELVFLLNSLQNSIVDIIYIIDNSLNDSLRGLKEYSAKIIYIHSVNVGYGSAHNIAIMKSISLNSKYHIVINPDVVFSADAVGQLASFMDENIDCGLIMPKVLYPDGRIQYLCKLLPTPIDLLGRRFFPFKKCIEGRNNRYELRFANYDAIMEVPSLSGCFMFLRIDVLKQTGGFDERYFMYAEDIDLCRRIGEISKTLFYPKVTVYHAYEKGSYKNGKLLKYHIISIVRYFNKWGWLFDRKRSTENRKCLNLLECRNIM